MTLIDLEELRKYPFRYDNYDRKNGSPHYIAGVSPFWNMRRTCPKLLSRPTSR